MTASAFSVAILIEPQLGLDYAAQLAAARIAESSGFDAFYRSDHYATPFAVADPMSTDAWTTLAGIARETYRIRLGCLVSPVTFRPASVLATVAATVQAMGHGQVELGIGAGWDADEHARFGIPFPSLADRLALLRRQALDIRRLWDEKPSRGIRPTLVVGGQGGQLSRAIAIQSADRYSLLRADPDRALAVNRELDAGCVAAGRDPRSLGRSVVLGLLVGEDDAGYARRRAALGGLLGLGDRIDEWLAPREPFWVHGTQRDLRDTLAAYRGAGCSQVVLEVFDGRDLDMIELAGRVAATEVA